MTADQWNTVLGAVAVAVAMLCNHLYYRARAALIERDDARGQTERATAFANERERWLRDGLRAQAERHEQEVARITAAHDAELLRLNAAAVARATEVDALAKSMTDVVSTAVLGGPRQEAKVIPMQPDAEMRGIRKIREESIQAGMNAIRADYDAQGIPISDEELRLQAIAFIEGDTASVFGTDP